MSIKYIDLEASNIENSDVIKRSIKNIINTPKGTIPAQPKKGSKIQEYIFSELDELDILDLEDYVNILISSSELRVNNVKTKVSFMPEYNRLLIKIEYRILASEEIDFASVSITI